MGFITTAGVALVLGHSLVAAQDVASAQYCDATQRTVCYAQFSASTSGTTYRVAIPAVSKAPFDTLVQIVAPNAVSWAGIAWGGSMSQNPLTVAWMNGNQGVVSSRWTTGHTPPAAYAGATYSVLSSSKNATHWQTNFLCTGCSSWETASMDPNGPNKIGYVTGNQAPATPASNTSSISIHSEKGSVTQDLSIGKVDSNAFRRFVLFLTNPIQGDPQGPPPPPADTPPSNPRTSSGRIPTTIIHASPTGGEDAPPATRTSVRTSVTTLPRPGSSPQPSSTTRGGPATVTVTVTRGAGTTTGIPARPTATGKGKATTTTTCFRRGGRAGRVCTSTPWDDEGDDDDDEGWNGGGGWGGGGWGRRNRAM